MGTLRARNNRIIKVTELLGLVFKTIVEMKTASLKYSCQENSLGKHYGGTVSQRSLSAQDQSHC